MQGWQLVSVFAEEADEISDDLIELVANPVTRDLITPSTVVLRRTLGARSEFYFSPEAASLLRPLVETHLAQPVSPPVISSRMDCLATGEHRGWRRCKERVEYSSRDAGWQGPADRRLRPRDLDAF